MNLWTYSPDDVNVLIGGFYSLKGIADGTFIKITKDLPPYTTSRSTDGMVARKSVVNSTFTIEISVLATSPANNVLTRFWQVDRLLNIGKFPILVKDSLGSGYFFSTTCWVEQIPSLEYSTSAVVNTWVIRAHDGAINIGGNDPQDDIINVADMALSALPYAQQILDRVGI